MIQLRAQLVRYEPGARMAAHADGCRRLSVLVGGAQREQAGARAESARVGSVALKGAEFEHHNRFDDAGCTILSLVLPDVALAALGTRADALLDWRWLHGGAAGLRALGLAACLRAGDGAGAARRLAALLASFTRDGDREDRRGAASRVDVAGASCPDSCSDPRTDPRVDPRAARTARALVQAPPDGAPSLAQLAAAEGLHPASLDRVFRRAHGCSVTTFRQRHRVRAVAEALLDADTPLVHVALRHGFADLSHMSRVFARELGVAPGRFRALLRSEPGRLDSFKTEWQLTA